MDRDDWLRRRRLLLDRHRRRAPDPYLEGVPMATVLLIGESWFTQLMEVKGFDSFTVSGYEVGTQWIEPALTGGGHDFRHLPSHLVDSAWPDLSDVDVVLVSDCGANTFLLGTATFTGGEPVSNKLAELAEFVRGGGGLGMIGGYLSFSGIDAKAQFAGTPLADVLPVVIADTDDRVELPQGVDPVATQGSHVALGGATCFGPLLGYNQVQARPEANVLAVCGDDPLVAIWEVGTGRAFVYTSDCGPHWASRSYADSPDYARLWQGLVGWAADGGK
jgi:uncharacterized membrane protein